MKTRKLEKLNSATSEISKIQANQIIGGAVGRSTGQEATTDEINCNDTRIWEDDAFGRKYNVQVLRHEAEEEGFL